LAIGELVSEGVKAEVGAAVEEGEKTMGDVESVGVPDEELVRPRAYGDELAGELTIEGIVAGARGDVVGAMVTGERLAGEGICELRGNILGLTEGCRDVGRRLGARLPGDANGCALGKIMSATFPSV
jgi:hypothetical protein